MTRTRNGLPGVYNSSPESLQNGDGAALALDSAGRLIVSPSDSVTSIADGRKVVTTAGTSVTLVSSTQASNYVIVTAETDNTGIISVGGSTVIASLSTRRGTPLSPGDSVLIKTTDLINIYIDSTVNGDGVTFTSF